MKIKARNKLIPAIAMLVVATVTLTSASYAWFTMSRTVQATGMNLTAIAPTNLLISNAVDGTYAETTTVTENFGESKLIPSSSLDGTTVRWAADNIKAANAGAPDAATTFIDAKATPIAASTGSNEDGDLVTHDGYFADFHLWLKTDGEDDVNVTLSQLATLTTIAKNDDKNLRDAVRFAVLDDTGALFAAGSKNVLAFENGAYTGTPDYFGTVTGPMSAAAITTDSWNGVADANLTDGSTIFTVAGGGTPKAIIVRVWVEGQDADCISANAAADMSLSVGFSDQTYTAGIHA